LKVKHIDSAQKIIRVEQSKGRKDRNVMLSPETLDLLRQWWKSRRSWYDRGTPVEERWLFPGTRRGTPMTTRQLSRLFHQAADAAGIKKAVTLHALRHYAECRVPDYAERFERCRGGQDVDPRSLGIILPLPRPSPLEGGTSWNIRRSIRGHCGARPRARWRPTSMPLLAG